MKKRIQYIAKLVWNWLVRYPLALLVSIGVILFASLLMLAGFGNRFNVGGLLGKLFGVQESDGDEVLVRANKVPEERTDEEGNPIEKGDPDPHGWVQHEVKALDRSRNPFRDKSVIVVEDEVGTQKKIKLPTGVEDTDVQMVIELQPRKFEVVVKEGPKKIDQDIIDKLRG